MGASQMARHLREGVSEDDRDILECNKFDPVLDALPIRVPV
jgi:hypothetical protein